jgi:hypothetical protein
MEVRALGGFAAVVPREPSPLLDDLANRCTTIFDAFRAPLSAQERARRVASGLSPSQMHNLDRWGYPYLFTDFRFHMTLTGKLPASRRQGVLSVLQRIFDQMYVEQSVAIDRLALVKQDHAHARFRILCQAELKR